MTTIKLVLIYNMFIRIRKHKGKSTENVHSHGIRIGYSKHVVKIQLVTFYYILKTQYNYYAHI